MQERAADSIVTADGSARSRLANRAGRLGLVMAVILMAANLRPALASVAPVLAEIQRSAGLSSVAAGALTTVPVLAFGACAPLAPLIGRRVGIEGALLGVLVVLGAGILVRSAPSLPALFIGTAAVGVAIAVGNVLLPALIKRDFPDRTRQMTGAYSLAIAAGSALGAGLTVPLERATGGGWRVGLDLWAVPVAIGVAAWAARVADAHRDIAGVRVSGRLWRDPLAWQVTAFMGLQSLEFYAMLAWLPTLFEQHGVRPDVAGALFSVAGVVSLPAAFFAPVLASTPGRQRAMVVVTILFNAAAIGGLLWRPAAGAVIWMVLLGPAQGAALSLALNFVVERAPSSERAAELSGMSQTVGYLVAGLGPLAVGALRQATGGWDLPLLLLGAILVPQLASGLGASRPLTVGGDLRQ